MPRRKLTKEFKALIADWKKNSARYGDRLTRLETFSMWEREDDVEADCQIVCNIIEHMIDVDAALENVKKYARKCAVFMIELDALRNAETWKKIIGRQFDIVQFEQFENRIVAITAPTKVGDIVGRIVSAGTDQSRWANIERNCKTYPKRVTSIPPHERKAVIACYGPTLAENIDVLRAVNGDVVSVSGSHDFLINLGIVPRFHIEADPRPHKAGNLAKAHAGVQYLLASMVDQAVFDKLAGGDISLWHVSGEQSGRIINELESDALLIGGRGNVGICAMPLMYELGYRDFHVFGMDCSFQDNGEKRHAGPHSNKNEPTELPLCEAMVSGRRFKTSPIYVKYAGLFLETRNALPDATFAMYGDSFLTAWCQFDQQTRQQQGAA